MNNRTNISLKNLSKEQLILIIEGQFVQINELRVQVDKLINQVTKLTKELEKYKHPKKK